MIDNEWDGTEAEAMQDMGADEEADAVFRRELSEEACKRREAMRLVYETNGRALTGEPINCPCCNKRVRKTHRQQRCCGSMKCKDRYHNTVNERRRERSVTFNHRAKF